ncbi:MAG: hypothetical protein ACR2LK_00090 [Solirubrobacteraceae bacterium]
MAVTQNLRRVAREKLSRGIKHSMGVAQGAIFEKHGQATYVVLGFPEFTVRITDVTGFSTQQRGLQNTFHVHGLGTTLASTNNCIAQPAIERWTPIDTKPEAIASSVSLRAPRAHAAVRTARRARTPSTPSSRTLSLSRSLRVETPVRRRLHLAHAVAS